MLFEDEHVLECQDNGRAVWVARLDDGGTFYEDCRPGSWARLREHLLRTGKRVTRVGVKFRTEWAWHDGEGPILFQSRAVMALLGEPQSDLLILGRGEIKDGKAHLTTTTFRVPERTVVDRSARIVALDDERLICTPTEPARK